MRDKCQIGEQNNQIPLRNSPPKTAKKKQFTVLDTIRGTVKRKWRNQSNQMAPAAATVAAPPAAAAATTIGDSSPHRAIVNKRFVAQNVAQIKIEHNNQRDMLLLSAAACSSSATVVVVHCCCASNCCTCRLLPLLPLPLLICVCCCNSNSSSLLHMASANDFIIGF